MGWSHLIRVSSAVDREEEEGGVRGDREEEEGGVRGDRG